MFTLILTGTDPKTRKGGIGHALRGLKCFPQIGPVVELIKTQKEGNDKEQIYSHLQSQDSPWSHQRRRKKHKRNSLRARKSFTASNELKKRIFKKSQGRSARGVTSGSVCI